MAFLGCFYDFPMTFFLYTDKRMYVITVRDIQFTATLLTVTPCAEVDFTTYTPAGNPSVAESIVACLLSRSLRPFRLNTSMSARQEVADFIPSAVVLLTDSGTYTSAAPRDDSFTYASCTPSSSELNDTVNLPPVIGNSLADSLNLLLFGPPMVSFIGSARFVPLTVTSFDTASFPISATNASEVSDGSIDARSVRP